jgi:hypothetical protein
MGLKIWSLSNTGFEPRIFRALAQRAYQLRKTTPQNAMTKHYK